MDFEWTNTDNPRPAFPVPSIYHQTILAKALFSHARSCDLIAAVAMSSKEIQNSSLSANFASSVPQISLKILPLYFTVFHPATSLALQFVTKFSISFVEQQFGSYCRRPPRSLEMDAKCRDLLVAMQNTNYMKKALHSLVITPPAEIVAENNKNGEKDLFEILLETCGSFEALESLTFNEYSPKQNHVPMLNALKVKLPYLQKFSIKFEGYVDQGDLKVVAQVKTLTHFNIGGSSKVDDVDVIDCLSGLENLKSINLAGFTHMNDDVLLPMSRFGATLTELDLAIARTYDVTNLRGNGVTDVGVGLICDNLPNIVKLSFYSNQAITDAGIAEHFHKLKQLEELNLRLCKEITDVGVAALMKGNRNLVDLQLEEAGLNLPSSIGGSGSAIDPFELMHPEDGYPLYCFPKLRRISIQSAKGFGSQGLRVLSRSDKLESIRFEYCTTTNEEFIKFDESPEGLTCTQSGIFKYVKELKIPCSRAQMDDGGLRVIARIFRNIEMLELNYWGDNTLHFDLKDADERVVLSDDDEEEIKHRNNERKIKYRCFRRLRELSLVGLQAISAEGWTRIGKMRNLERLDLNHCRSLGRVKNGLRLLTSTMPLLPENNNYDDTDDHVYVSPEQEVEQKFQEVENYVTPADEHPEDRLNRLRPLPNLSELNISTTGVDASEVMTCIPRLKSLTLLQVQGCEGLLYSFQKKKLHELCPGLDFSS